VLPDCATACRALCMTARHTPPPPPQLPDYAMRSVPAAPLLVPVACH
jgi:hypothetical protein